MCGIIGLLLANEEEHVNQMLFDGLTVLQHRGQDAAGMVTAERCRLHLRKDNGLVKDVFGEHHMNELRGHMGIAHCRYPTAGTSSCAEAQPLYTNYPYGICVAHNGNLTNTEELATQLQETAGRHVNTDSDSELLLNVFAEHLTQEHRRNKKGMEEAIFSAISKVMKECRGGYAGLYLINGFGLVAFRDPRGIRPLVFGCRKRSASSSSSPTPHSSSSFQDDDGIPKTPAQMGDAEKKYDYVVSSESVAIDTLGFQLIRDVKAGEAIFIDMEGNCHSRICHDQGLSPCIFEYVYFARPDSIMDGISVYETRLKMGEKLAQKILKQTPNHDIDVVIPIPDTSRTSALQAAYTLNRPFREGFIKNRYIARTFIMPGQATRKKSVRLKLNTIKSEFAGRNVLLVDDSIVRGTTANEIVQMARDAGARKVYFSSAAPPIRFPNIYGIDIPTRQELIAYERSEDEIAKKIGCERVVYQDLNDLEDSVREAALTTPSPVNKFDTSCFSGIYVTGETIGDSYFERLHNKRNDGAKEQRKRGHDGMENGGTPAKKPAGSHDGCESVTNDKRVANSQLGAGCEPLSNHQVGRAISSSISSNRTLRATSMTNLRALGFCGADDSVHPRHLVVLANSYPLVEFGILFRPDKEGQPRYATTAWVQELAALKPKDMKLAAHLCGARVNEILGGDSAFLKKITIWGFTRVQINATIVNGVDTSNMASKVPFIMKVFDVFPQVEFILQKNAETQPLWQGILDAGIPENVSMLVDESKGTGVAASSWPSPSPDYRIGYAGGIGPHNVRSVLEKINKVAANETVWIDMESSLRSIKNDKDVFDLDKCFAVIETVSEMGYPLNL